MWRNRNVWIILLGEFVVGLGLWAGIIGNLAFMQEVVPSDFHKSLIISCGILAGLVVGPMAGRIIDQSKKKRLSKWQVSDESLVFYLCLSHFIPIRLFG